MRIFYKNSAKIAKIVNFWYTTCVVFCYTRPDSGTPEIYYFTYLGMQNEQVGIVSNSLSLVNGQCVGAEVPAESFEALFRESLWVNWDTVANILTPQVSTDKSFMNEFPAYDSYYQEMSDEEIEIKLESICERSCSDEEVLSKIEKELRYAWWPPLITSVSCGSMIMFHVMIDGPRGNIIQI